ncbi:MAG TPA: hypothetical protein VF899_08715 [Pyrinomonadaceae bacterium]
MRKRTFATFLMLVSCALAYGIQAETEWIKFTSAEGQFSVLLPHKPKFEAITDPSIKELTNYRYTELEKGYGFICEYYDLPSTGADLQSFLDDTRDGIIRGAGATKVGEEKITLDGYPGRELELAFRVNDEVEMTALTRIYVVGKRLYSLTYVRAKDLDPRFASETAAKFFSSFTVTPRK